MEKNKSGFSSGGKTQPEIRPGDVWKDSHGSRITIQAFSLKRVTYFREGYSAPCVCSPGRLIREFTLVAKAPPAAISDLDRVLSVVGAERIRVMREIIQERGKQK
ncbi:MULTISPECIES: DUF4222 domain-containing protein [Enterobacter cloacae complex]|uniref:DUF4222 domain-containing protein n=1 Tax=Enterobacter cloacae complex TaxID=354276 RepID=UPI003075FF75